MFIFWGDTLTDLTFSNFMLPFCGKVSLGDPFKIQREPRCHPKAAKFRSVVKQMHDTFGRWRVYVRDLFLQSCPAPPPPLRILERLGLSFGSLFDRFRTPLLFNFAVRWTCCVKALPSKLGLVKMGRDNNITNIYEKLKEMLGIASVLSDCA